MKRLIFLGLTCASYFLHAQESEPIVTDRPTQSAASAVVPKGSVLIEYGFVHEKAGDFTNTTFANLLARVGIIDGVEFRITQNIQQIKNGMGEKVNGLSPITLGTKVHLVKENGFVPQISVIGQVTLDNGKEEFRPGKSIPEVRLNFSNSISESLALGYNIGMIFPEDDSQMLYSIVLGYAMAPGWTLFAEPYGFFQDGVSDHRFNAGLIYLMSNRVQFDISGGVGLSDVSPDSFIGIGAAVGF